MPSLSCLPAKASCSQGTQPLLDTVPPHLMLGPTVPLSAPDRKAKMTVSAGIAATLALTSHSMGSVPSTVQIPAAQSKLAGC